MNSDYGYINARIRAMKSFLLKEQDYQEALRQQTHDEFVSFLSSLPTYANDVRQTLVAPSIKSSCDEVLKLNLSRILRKMVNFCAGEPKELILILLAPWDMYNLKTIIRGIFNVVDKNEIIQAFIAVGKWDLDFLTTLAHAGDLKTVATILESVGEDGFEKEFAHIIKGYAYDTPLELLENRLTELYFRKAGDYLRRANTNAKTVLDYLNLQIDFLNIRLVLKKIAHAQRNEPADFIQGGRLSGALLRDAMRLKSIEDVLKLFKESPYPWLAEEGLLLYKRSQRLSSLERLLKNRLFCFCVNEYSRGNPLSISIPLAFINFKESEIRNLRFIHKSICFGIPADLVREELIFAR